MNKCVLVEDKTDMEALLDILESIKFDLFDIRIYRRNLDVFVFPSHIEIDSVERYFCWGSTDEEYTIDQIKAKPKNFLLF